MVSRISPVIDLADLGGCGYAVSIWLHLDWGIVENLGLVVVRTSNVGGKRKKELHVWILLASVRKPGDHRCSRLAVFVSVAQPATRHNTCQVCSKSIWYSQALHRHGRFH
jgi:hypothetical protein